jgi:hypothetical protein
MCLLEGKNKSIPMKETDMTSIADSAVITQTSSRTVPSPPSWFGEVALIVEHLRKQGVLTAISERVRFARRRFGHYEVIDFVAVLFGYAVSSELTLEAFYERLTPGQRPSWHSSGVTGYLHARRSVAFLPVSLGTPQKPCGSSF